MVIAVPAAFFFFAIVIFLDEPKVHMIEVKDDGTVEMIEVK
jgi:hypothetical protein